MARGDIVLNDPVSFEGDGVEEPKRGHRDDDRTGREPSLPRQVEQIRPDLSWPEKVGRFTKVAGEMDDLRDIHSLRVWCHVADLHVLDHATAKRAHGQLPCETISATWRRRYRPAVGLSGQGEVADCCHERAIEIGKP